MTKIRFARKFVVFFVFGLQSLSAVFKTILRHSSFEVREQEECIQALLREKEETARLIGGDKQFAYEGGPQRKARTDRESLRQDALSSRFR